MWTKQVLIVFVVILVTANSQRLDKRKKHKEESDDEGDDYYDDSTEETFPQTAFSCDGKIDGFYADIETGCRVFHYCQTWTFPEDGEERKDWAFVCPPTTIFRQEYLTCSKPKKTFRCEDSEQYYDVNEDNQGPVTPPPGSKPLPTTTKPPPTVDDDEEEEEEETTTSTTTTSTTENPDSLSTTKPTTPPSLPQVPEDPKPPESGKEPSIPSPPLTEAISHFPENSFLLPPFPSYYLSEIHRASPYVPVVSTVVSGAPPAFIKPLVDPDWYRIPHFVDDKAFYDTAGQVGQFIVDSKDFDFSKSNIFGTGFSPYDFDLPHLRSLPLDKTFTAGSYMMKNNRKSLEMDKKDKFDKGGMMKMGKVTSDPR